MHETEDPERHVGKEYLCERSGVIEIDGLIAVLMLFCVDCLDVADAGMDV